MDLQWNYRHFGKFMLKYAACEILKQNDAMISRFKLNFPVQTSIYKEMYMLEISDLWHDCKRERVSESEMPYNWNYAVW